MAALVVCLGSANLDHVVEVDALPAGEGKVIARGARWSGGGLAATAAVAVRALGGAAIWAGLVGDDQGGRVLVGLLTDAGVGVAAGAVVEGAETPVAAVLVDRDGARWLAFHPGQGLDPATPPAVPDLDGAACVVADGWSTPLSTAAFESARDRGVPSVLDCELVDGPEAAGLAALADHVLFSAEGLARFTGTADVDTALADAASRLPDAVVAVTLGAEGSAWAGPDGATRLPAPRVRARDTTGCGDVFHGAYALAIAEGAPVPQAARFATAAAALKAERGEGWAGMPDRRRTDALVSRGWS